MEFGRFWTAIDILVRQDISYSQMSNDQALPERTKLIHHIKMNWVHSVTWPSIRVNGVSDISGDRLAFLSLLLKVKLKKRTGRQGNQRHIFPRLELRNLVRGQEFQSRLELLEGTHKIWDSLQTLWHNVFKSL